MRLGLLLALSLFGSSICFGEQPEAVIDATTMKHKVLCGYQGWFRCPGDPAERGWVHWSRNGRRITPETLTFEMWPDMSEYAKSYPAGDFQTPEGNAAKLFSSADFETVDLHFRWMKQYGIDGVFLQRFLVEVGKPDLEFVLDHVRKAARNSGRTWALTYDLSGMPEEQIFDKLTRDWKRLVDEKQITQEERYLHHEGKPVLFVWGFYSDRFSPELAHRLIDFFRADGPYQVTLIGGCQWDWRNEKDPEWAKAFRRFDLISPWNVGNTSLIDGRKQAATGSWKEDLEEARKVGMEYFPVIYPGFGWTNLKGRDASRATIPRLGGEFFWRQFVIAAELNCEMVYVAMFDEVDEATAIFKVTNTPPAEAPFQTYEDLPSDWYLRLTGEGSQLIRGERKPTVALPISPPRGD